MKTNRSEQAKGEPVINSLDESARGNAGNPTDNRRDRLDYTKDRTAA